MTRAALVRAGVSLASAIGPGRSCSEKIVGAIELAAANRRCRPNATAARVAATTGPGRPRRTPRRDRGADEGPGRSADNNCIETTMLKSKPNLPWVEKYRPNTLDDLISHEDIIQTISKYIKEDQLPHLLFYGPPGTGKTSTILACAKQLYTPSQFRSMVLELNASDDRGIGVVRGQIMNFASTRTIFKTGYKLIILDEADAMTNDAQNALRRIIEKFTDNVRFCLICNYLSKIIPALQSRCTRFRFGPLDFKQIMPRLEYVIGEENVKVTEDGKKALIDLAQGDMRKVLNILQSAATAFPEVNEDSVYTCVGHPLKSDIMNILKWLLNDEFITAYKKIQEIKIQKGLALQDILTELHTFLYRLDLPPDCLIDILTEMAEIEVRLNGGTCEKIHLGSLISAFHMIRSKLKPADN